MSIADLIARLEALDKAATPDLEIVRYPHGGGRVFGTDGRTLVADFYNEADREYWLALRNELPRLLRLLRAGENAKGSLERCDEYMDQRADADLAPGGEAMQPNREMVLMQEIRAALREWDEAARG